MVGTVGPSGVLVEVGVARKTKICARVNIAGYARSGVVIEHDDHGDIVGGGAGGGGAIGVSVISALIGNEIVVAEEPQLKAPGEVAVDLGEVRKARVSRLAKVGGVGVTGKGTTGIAEDLGVGVAVGVDEAETCAGVVQGVLELALGGVVAVVAGGMHYAEGGGEPSSARAI